MGSGSVHIKWNNTWAINITKLTDISIDTWNMLAEKGNPRTT